MPIRGKSKPKRRKGAFDHIIDDLPRYDGLEPKQREKVDATRAEILMAPQEGDPNITEADLEAAIVSLEDIYVELLWAVTRMCARSPHAATFTRGYLWARRLEDVLDDMAKRKNILLQAYLEMVIDYYEIEGTTTLKLADGEGARLEYVPHAVVKDREKFQQWCIANGFGPQLQLPWQTTNAETKDRLAVGLPEPDGVEAYNEVKVIYVPAK
jgi:hypothetical protein